VKKKYKNFSIRRPRFKKKGQKKNIPSLEALERQALSRLKTYITPLPLLLQLQKKEQLIIFCVIKDKKILYENHSPWFSLTSL